MGPSGAALDGAAPPPERPATHERMRVAAYRLGGPVVIGAAIVLLWIILARTTSRDILPGPDLVWSRFVLAWQDGEYWPAVWTTFLEAFVGWTIAVVVALP